MTTDTLRVGRRDDLPSVARLLTLSDNVVAIALTLLVLQLKVPPHVQVADPGSAADLAAQLAKEADALISYVVAFYVVAQFWLAHHRVFRHVAGHDEGLAWWNFAFLFTITAMPFTSNLLGEYGGNPLAVDIFAVNLLLAARRPRRRCSTGSAAMCSSCRPTRRRPGRAGHGSRSSCSPLPCRSAWRG
jgi:uncharacterized membrane protein